VGRGVPGGLLGPLLCHQVTDAAQAAFDVEDYEAFVTIQAETAVRHVASVFPYDTTRRVRSRCGRRPTG
jgi:hypothetical protein